MDPIEFSRWGDQDHLRLGTVTLGEFELAIMSIKNGQEGSVYYLDHEEARQLFNWLGVWLHKW